MHTQTAHDAARREAEDLYRQTGPFTSLYLDLDAADDPRRIDLRWRKLRGELSDAGAPEADLAVLDSEVATARAHPGPRVLASFCVDGRLVFSHTLEGADASDHASFGAMPVGGPCLAWVQQRVTYLVVVTDHTGADISVRHWPAETLSVSHVEGSNDEIVSHPTGGWAALAQSRYQRRVVDSWEHNATEVAVAVTHQVDEARASLVILTGDIRSVPLLRHALPAHVQPMVRTVDVGSTRNGTSPALEADVLGLVERTIAARTDELLRTWRDLSGPGGRAVAGLPATGDALREGRVETLLVAYDAANQQEAWVGPDPRQVAADYHTLAAMGLPLHRAPLGDAFIGAALATGADVHVLDDVGDLSPDGVAAVLRFR